MPNTKNYSTRLRVLDQCLRSGHAYSGKELTEFINRELELRGEPTITSRTTLLFSTLIAVNGRKSLKINKVTLCIWVFGWRKLSLHHVRTQEAPQIRCL